MSGRLFEILYYLLDVKQTTARELAHHFEVSMRTIYRDIDRLLVAGIPIITMSGKDGGICLDPQFVFNKTLLSKQEQESILIALNHLSSLHVDEYTELKQRLSVLFQKESQDWLDVDFSSWYQNDMMNEKFELLKEVIIDEYAITFDYIHMQGQYSQKYVYPLKIIFKSRAWYLQAYDVLKEDFRIYKLTRMAHIEKQDESFQRCQYVIPPIPCYEESYEWMDVILKFDLSLGSFVYDEYQQSEIIKQTDGYIVKTKVKYTKWLLSFLLSFGHGVEVIEPLRLRQELETEIKKLMELYKLDR